jgi:hypothetical protein
MATVASEQQKKIDALKLPIHCDEIDDGLGYCLFE